MLIHHDSDEYIQNTLTPQTEILDILQKGLAKPKEQPERCLLPQDHPVEYQPGFL